MRELYSILYAPAELLYESLLDYRLYWILDFIMETCTDLYADHKEVLNDREKAVCRKLSNQKFIKSVKAMKDMRLLRRRIAMCLYETFKICRKLNLDDKQIVIENFNLNRIEK